MNNQELIPRIADNILHKVESRTAYHAYALACRRATTAVFVLSANAANAQTISERAAINYRTVDDLKSQVLVADSIVRANQQVRDSLMTDLRHKSPRVWRALSEVQYRLPVDVDGQTWVYIETERSHAMCSRPGSGGYGSDGCRVPQVRLSASGRSCEGAPLIAEKFTIAKLNRPGIPGGSIS